MRNFLKVALLVVGPLASTLSLEAQNKPVNLDQVVERVAVRESALVSNLHQYTPLVETYIQNLRQDKDLGSIPAGDKYFLGRGELTNGIKLHSLSEKSTAKRRVFGNLGGFFSFALEYLPAGFLQMIYIDTEGFNRQNYNFEYVRREFLGEVRCLVFDVTPLPKSGRGRFVGRIWVEDQDFNIVRFNGAYTGSTRTKFYFHFDSWRVNAGSGQWLPAFVYSEETNMNYGLVKTLHFKAQTRLWGYNLGNASREQELSRVLVEAATPVTDQTESSKDLSPIESQRSWDRQAEDNVIERMERIGLLAPRGEVDKVLETVVNNLEVTNNLDLQPEVRCRVLLTSTLESFNVGRTLVLSRGLIDVLPDEAALATMVAHELAHVALGHRIDTQFAFYDRLVFKDEDTFQHFGFARNQTEEDAASQKAMELLKNSPYKDSLGNAVLFLQALEERSKQVPSLVSPHLGSRVPVNTLMQLVSAQTAAVKEDKKGKAVSALPLGGRIKLDPWTDRIEMLKSKPVGMVAEREKMPFEVTPFMLYLTRQTATQLPATVTASSKPDDTKKPQ